MMMKEGQKLMTSFMNGPKHWLIWHRAIEKKYPQQKKNEWQHKDLNFDSHKRFCTRDFACWPYILGHGKSKKKLSKHLPQQKLPYKSPGGVRTRELLDSVIRLNFIV